MSAARVKIVRALAVVAALCVLAAVAAAGGALWLLGTERGTAFAFARAAPHIESFVRIGGVEGTLAGRLVLRNVEIAAGAERISIDRLALEWRPAALLDGALEIGRLDAGTVAHRREPTAATTAAAAGGFELPLAVRVGRAEVGRLELDGLGEALERISFGAEGKGSRIALAELAAHVRGFDLGGRAALAFAPLGLDAALAWQGDVAGESASGTLAVAGEWPVLRFEHRLQAPFAATAAGELSLAAEPTVDATVEWQGLAWPSLLEWASSPSGRLTVQGGLDGVRFAVTGEVLVEDHRLELDARGTADRAEIVLDALELGSAHGALVGEGTFALAEQRWEASFDARDVDPSALAPDWPGRLLVRARTAGALAPVLAWRVDAAALEGELRGYPVAGSGSVAGGPDGIELTGVRLASGDNRLEIDGRVGETLALAIDAELADLEAAWPGLAGAVTADLAISGTRAAPAVQGTAAARELEYAGWSVAALDAAADVEGGAGRVSIAAERVRRGAFTVNRVAGEVDGRLDGHSVTLAAFADEWEAAAAADGALADGRWQGTVARLDVDQPALGPWRLADPAPLRLGAGTVALETSCLAQGRTRLCAELRLEGAAEDSLVVAAQNFELGALRPFLPPEVELDGIYQLSASFADLRRAPRGSLSVVGGTTRASAALDADRAPLTLTLDDLVLTAELADWRLAVRSVVHAEEGAIVDLRAEMADIRRTDSPIDGELEASIPDLAFAAVLSPDVDRVAGRASVELEIGGTAADPELDGRAELVGGEIAVPEWGLQVTGIEARAESADGRALEFVATGLVEDRTVEVRGQVELDPRAGWPAELTLTGESIHAVARPDADVFVTPNLRAVVRLPDVTVTGTVHVPRARIEVGQLPEQAVAPSADAVVHGVDAPAPARPLRMLSDLLITLGSEVEYRALNLDADVSGEMRLRRTSDVATNASGSLTLAGTYNAYGQTLALERGQLLFTGPLDDPALDVRAVRRIESTTVGVELTGTVKSPETRIYSEPPMSEADALAYLLFGRPLTGTGSEETATLQTAALAMGLQQALPVVQRIGQSLGLDEFTVQTTDADAGSLMAGKYLSPKVYIRYSYGLVNRIGGLLLRFRVNERLSIETRSGEQKSMDLLYTVEKE